MVPRSTTAARNTTQPLQPSTSQKAQATRHEPITGMPHGGAGTVIPRAHGDPVRQQALVVSHLMACLSHCASHLPRSHLWHGIMPCPQAPQQQAALIQQPAAGLQAHGQHQVVPQPQAQPLLATVQPVLHPTPVPQHLMPAQMNTHGTATLPPGVQAGEDQTMQCLTSMVLISLT
jgi:hypothetical protein